MNLHDHPATPGRARDRRGADRGGAFAEVFDPSTLPPGTPEAVREATARLADLGGDRVAPTGFDPAAYTRHERGAELRDAAFDLATAMAAPWRELGGDDT